MATIFRDPIFSPKRRRYSKAAELNGNSLCLVLTPAAAQPDWTAAWQLDSKRTRPLFWKSRNEFVNPWVTVFDQPERTSAWDLSTTRVENRFRKTKSEVINLFTTTFDQPERTNSWNLDSHQIDKKFRVTKSEIVNPFTTVFDQPGQLQSWQLDSHRLRTGWRPGDGGGDQASLALYYSFLAAWAPRLVILGGGNDVP